MDDGPIAPSGKHLRSAWLAEVAARWTPAGLPGRPGLAPRLDATAWFLLAGRGQLEPALEREALSILRAAQEEDGRVPERADAPSTIWTTALCALAFEREDGGQSDARDRALDFLTTHEGVHHPRDPDSPVSHDTDLLGWPWVEGSAAWVEPTALALLALRRGGRGDHPRAEAARAMLFDRQLPGGGWNHGNVEVLGKRFPSVVVATGLTLVALDDLGDDPRVLTAKRYLQAAPADTLLSLCWQVLGSGAPPTKGATAALGEALGRMRSLAPPDSAHLALAALAVGGLPLAPGGPSR